MSFVLDASLALAWCFQDETTEPAASVRDRLASDVAIVPRVLWDLEVWNALLVAQRKGRIASVEENARLIVRLPVRRHPAPLERALELALRHGLSSYDALYLALAVSEGLSLATLDQRLGSAAVAEGLEVLGVG